MFDKITLYLNTFVDPWNQEREQKINQIEVLGISWGFHFVYTFYSVFSVFLGVKSYEYFSESKDFTHLVLDTFSFSFQKISLFIQLGTVILYPVVFHFSYKFWVYLLNFYCQVFESSLDEKANVNEVVNAMYSANVFLIIPIAGALFSFLGFTYILYRGAVKKLNFTQTQSFLVLMTPFFIIFLVAILIVSYFIFLFSLI